MNISKKLISYFLIGFLCFSSCSITYYKSVHAFEWVEVGLSTAEALKWLLGALGIVATGSAAVDNFWSGYEEEFYEYASDENISGPDVRAWLEKLAKGTLDKGSDVWNVFKSWASNLVTENSSGSSDGIGPGSGNILFTYNLGSSPSAILQAYMTSRNLGTISNNYTFLHDNVYCCFGYYVPASSRNFMRFFYTDTSYYMESAYNLNYSVPVSTEVVEINNNGTIERASSNESLSSYCYLGSQNNYVSNNVRFYDDVINLQGVIGVTEGSISDSGTLDTISDARQEQFDLINRNTGNEVEQEVAIPMPGLASGDDTISQDSYDSIMDRVEAGEISIDDAISDIQEIMQVLVYDTETDDVIPLVPDPEDSNENQKKDDVIKENKSNMGFTLAGLENVFPFCIPWDIYAFLNILDAEPVAPVFNIPFPNVDDPEHPLTTQVDLSSWDDAMRIVRLAQDFLFIIGLAFLTRSMIGAGGGD